MTISHLFICIEACLESLIQIPSLLTIYFLDSDASQCDTPTHKTSTLEQNLVTKKSSDKSPNSER